MARRNAGAAPTRTFSRLRAVHAVTAVIVAAVLVLAVGVFLDYRSFDQTSGGYEPPYTDWTGTPIDWAATEQTSVGFRQPGRVINSRLDCTTGMITLELAFLNFQYRQVSPRAIAVHQPREACEAAGFSPQF